MNRRPIDGNCFVAREKKKVYSVATLWNTSLAVWSDQWPSREPMKLRESASATDWIFFYGPKVPIYTPIEITLSCATTTIEFKFSQRDETKFARSMNRWKYESDVAKIDVGFNGERFSRSQNTSPGEFSHVRVHT